jgi:hypothetical protein
LLLYSERFEEVLSLLHAGLRLLLLGGRLLAGLLPALKLRLEILRLLLKLVLALAPLLDLVLVVLEKLHPESQQVRELTEVLCLEQYTHEAALTVLVNFPQLFVAFDLDLFETGLSVREVAPGLRYLVVQPTFLEERVLVLPVSRLGLIQHLLECLDSLLGNFYRPGVPRLVLWRSLRLRCGVFLWSSALLQRDTLLRHSVLLRHGAFL